MSVLLMKYSKGKCEKIQINESTTVYDLTGQQLGRI